MTLATAVIPVSPKHQDSGIYEDAIQSVRNQTLPTEFITIFDTEGRGAAYARNMGTQQVTTPFVIYLDADDVLKPSFVEDCLKVYERGTYVYSDWVINGAVIRTPDCLMPFDAGMQHVVTTLLPVAAWRSTDGFDETLDTLEDEDFYTKLHAYGWCGVRCSEPLIVYRRHHGASLVNKDHVALDTMRERVAEKQALFHQRYRRYANMADCGCISKSNKTQIGGARQPNDVLVEALYTPQKVQGAMTGRLYPRAGLGKPLWVHIDDAKSRPDMFRIISENPVTVSPDAMTVKRLAEEAIAREASA